MTASETNIASSASYCNMDTKTRAFLHFVLILSSIQCFFVSSFEYHVGGIHGWVVPSSNDSRIYNDWASENRFKVGDTIRFRYGKDSVMEVTEEEYKDCNSGHPRFFSNNGNTLYKLDRSGSYYFISGATGHCQKGQRMIVKVMSESDDDSSGDSHGGHKKSAASPLMFFLAVPQLVMLQILLFSSCVLLA